MSTPVAKKWGQVWRQDRADGIEIPCGICGLRITRSKRTNRGGLSVDHITPLSLGGKDTLNNIQPAHSKCNSVKGSRIKISKQELEKGLKKLGVTV